MKNKILFLLLSIVLLTSCTKRDEVAENNSTTVVETDENLIAKDSRIEAIDKERYDSVDSYIEFLELPNTYAETLVANYYLMSIRNEAIKQFSLQSNFQKSFMPTEEDAAEYVVPYNWIKVEKVHELNFEELQSLEDYKDLFSAWHRDTKSKLDYDDYVKAILDSNCKIVEIKYTNKYFDFMIERSPQLPDGKFHDLWLLGEEDGELRLFENTIFGNVFFISSDKANQPSFAYQ